MSEDKNYNSRENLKARQAELGQILIEDSISGLLEFFVRSVATAPSLLSFLSRQGGKLRMDCDLAGDPFAGMPVAYPPPPVTGTSSWYSVDNDFNGGYHAGRMDACLSLAKLRGWELPEELFLDLVTKKVDPATLLTALWEESSMANVLKRCAPAAS
jgi:hypothetical protein